jgi:hypothetical protein
VKGSSHLSTAVIAVIAVVVSVVVLAALGITGFIVYKRMMIIPTKDVPLTVLGVPVIEGVTVKHKLGGGNFGEVYLLAFTSLSGYFNRYMGMWNGATVALKKFKDPEHFEEFQKEATLLHKLSHPSI